MIDDPVREDGRTNSTLSIAELDLLFEDFPDYFDYAELFLIQSATGRTLWTPAEFYEGLHGLDETLAFENDEVVALAEVEQIDRPMRFGPPRRATRPEVHVRRHRRRQRIGGRGR